MAKAKISATTAPAAAMWAITDSGAKLADRQELLTTQRNMEYAKREWRTMPDGKVVRNNTRGVVLATLESLGEFTWEDAVAALDPLAKAGLLGAGSTARGYLGWCKRVGHIAPL